MRTPALAALVLALLLGAVPAAARVEEATWSEAQKAFHSRFKAKAGVRDRAAAVSALGGVPDGRGVDLLLDAVAKQEKRVDDAQKAWFMEEAAWSQKTLRLEKSWLEKMRRAKDGGKVPAFTAEENEWLGLAPPFEGEAKSKAEKARIEGLYEDLLEEEGVAEQALRGVAKVLNSVDGPEYDAAAATAAAETRTAVEARRIAGVKMFGRVRGEGATAFLEEMSKDPCPQVAQTALEALGRQNSERGMEILIARLEDPRWQMRAAAIAGLSFYRDARAVDALIARAKREQGVLLRNHFTALARIVQKAAAGTAEAWESWWLSHREEVWKTWPNGGIRRPIEGDPPDVPVETAIGATSFYGIATNSKHMLFLVDVSASMGEPGGRNEQGRLRIETARDELVRALGSLTAADGDERGPASFNMVVFGTEVETFRSGYMVEATKENKDEALRWIEAKVRPTTNTNVFGALEAAFETADDASGPDTIYFMSDGEPNRGTFVDPSLILREVRRRNEPRRLTIHTIGVGADPKAAFLRALATQNGGQYIAR